MRVEFLGDYRERVRVTKGWLSKVTYIVVRHSLCRNHYPVFAKYWAEHNYVYEGTTIRCSDSLAISRALARLERRERRAIDREERVMERERRRALKNRERDHLKGLGRLPEARLLRKA